MKTKFTADRVSRPKTLFKKSILENLAKLRKTPMPESLFDKVSPSSPAWNFIKKRLQRRCFPLNFCEFFKCTYFLEQLLAAASLSIIIFQQIFYYVCEHHVRVRKIACFKCSVRIKNFTLKCFK